MTDNISSQPRYDHFDTTPNKYFVFGVIIKTFSSQPRYDRFDISAYLIVFDGVPVAPAAR